MWRKNVIKWNKWAVEPTFFIGVALEGVRNRPDTLYFNKEVYYVKKEQKPLSHEDTRRA